jgi:4-hydroxy-2-oxoheptanedioate aldolase
MRLNFSGGIFFISFVGITDLCRCKSPFLLSFSSVGPILPQISCTKQTEEFSMRSNKLRELLNADKPTLGTHVHSTWPSVIEAVGHTGVYDYVEFVAEYGPFTLHDFDNLCRAAELYNMSSMIKVDQEPRGFLAQRAIGSGFQSVLFADCRTADEVRECVQITNPDTPQDNGTYGVGTRRFAYMGYGGSPDYVQALRDVVVVIMIEKKGTVDQLEEILEIEGVDMIQWGGSDFSMSIGQPGNHNHPDVVAAKKKVFETCIKMGVPARAEVNTVDQAKEYLDMGVKHFCIGTDIAILFSWWKQHGEDFRKVLDA